MNSNFLQNKLKQSPGGRFNSISTVCLSVKSSKHESNRTEGAIRGAEQLRHEQTETVEPSSPRTVEESAELFSV